MEFRLIFEGEVMPRQRASLSHIHALRRLLHPQMKALWDFPPLTSRQNWLRLDAPAGDYAFLEERNGRIYAPLITRRADLLAELDIIFLRQQAPGQLIGDGGDIDNRMKTLFDALRVPSVAEVRQLGAEVDADENPMHCLLQDDSLISKVSIETDRLLRPVLARELVAIIKVRLKVTRVTLGTMGLLA